MNKKMPVRLKGLEGVKKEVVKAYFFSTVNAGMEGLETSRFMTAADRNGSINIWRRDDKSYAGERHFYMQVVSSVRCGSKVTLRRWLAEQLPEIKENV